MVTNDRNMRMTVLYNDKKLKNCRHINNNEPERRQTSNQPQASNLQTNEEHKKKKAQRKRKIIKKKLKNKKKSRPSIFQHIHICIFHSFSSLQPNDNKNNNNNIYTPKFQKHKTKKNHANINKFTSQYPQPQNHTIYLLLLLLLLPPQSMPF